jgi:ABC-type protease/lipase transport system fused ATPase/permease subunit
VVLQRVALAGAQPDTPILRHVEFDLAAGRALGVLGPSGAGKSSLLRVVAGGWAPTAGAVTLDGAELRQWPDEALGRHVGYLPQEAGLLPGTVAQNIARFQPGTADLADAGEAVVDAARRAGVYELVLALPQGFDTVLGEGGHTLSAGQAQRVALARALYGHPRLVVLDEPNAHLDAEGEQALLRVLAELRTARVTVVMSTHKLALLQALDDLLVLQAGRMEMMGPRDAVLARLAPGGAPQAGRPA